jgi:hypothetical protein
MTGSGCSSRRLFRSGERHQESKHTGRGNRAASFTAGEVEAMSGAGDRGVDTEIGMGEDDDGKRHRRRRGGDGGFGIGIGIGIGGVKDVDDDAMELIQL